eukprot:GFUD01098384.1.p1 GENE.GFUD01098384.1~~GFUD01098384.1.p1  ORF type:complete len:441 (-),score=84.36 GFUD01098384.1:109-1431(-)
MEENKDNYEVYYTSLEEVRIEESAVYYSGLGGAKRRPSEVRGSPATENIALTPPVKTNSGWIKFAVISGLLGILFGATSGITLYYFISAQTEDKTTSVNERTTKDSHLNTLLATGRDDENYLRNTEILSVTKTNGQYTLFSIFGEDIIPTPNNIEVWNTQERGSGFLASCFMTAIGRTNKILLQWKTKTFVYQDSKWTHLDTPISELKAWHFPAIAWGDGFLTIGGGVHLSENVSLYQQISQEPTFTKTVLGKIPGNRGPTEKNWMMDHKITRIDNNRFIITGGRDYNRKMLNTVYEGTIINGSLTFRILQPMKQARGKHCSFLIGTKLVVVGGTMEFNIFYDRMSPLKTVEYLDLEWRETQELTTVRWQSGPDIPYTLMGMTCEANKEFAVIAGGFVKTNTSSATDRVMVMKNDLTTQIMNQTLRQKRYEHESVKLNNK